MTKDKPRVYIEEAQPLTAEGIKKVCNLEKPLRDKVYWKRTIDGNQKVHLSKDVKEAIEEAEDFIISMKRDDDLQWNMRLNLILEEFRTKIFGEFK